jgi:hypothetical protein
LKFFRFAYPIIYELVTPWHCHRSWRTLNPMVG